MVYRITLHHTVGRYNQLFSDYHYCITYDKAKDVASVVKGKYKPEDNDSTSDGKYAPHCKMANTGNVGIGICACLGYDSKTHTSPTYPITGKQIELAFRLMAELCIKYNIKIEEVQTHYERDQKLGPKKSGKVDILFIPSYPDVKPQEVGNFIRKKVQWYINQIKSGKIKKGLI